MNPFECTSTAPIKLPSSVSKAVTSLNTSNSLFSLTKVVSSGTVMVGLLELFENFASAHTVWSEALPSLASVVTSFTSLAPVTGIFTN
ncbi:hypothetical protein D3C81_1692460 [compost metagenome]